MDYHNNRKGNMTKDNGKRPEKKDTITNWLILGELDDEFLVSDISTHGCDGGVPGVTYYKETIAFHDTYEKEIWDLLKQHADENMVEMRKMLFDLQNEQGSSSITQLKNDLAWWSIEVRAQEIMAARTAPAAAGGTT